MTLAAGQTECQTTVQPALLGAPGEEASLAALVDRLANRLGPGPLNFPLLSQFHF